MKIVCTIHDAAMAANVGDSVEATSVILDVPVIPRELEKYFKDLAEFKERNKDSDRPMVGWYSRLSFSLLNEI